MATVVIPNPQNRYLEPYKNRTYQYDNKHSNLFLSQYVNNILRAVGNDIIIRGLEVIPSINSTSDGIIFDINPGSLIQDLTYIEFPLPSRIELTNLLPYSDQYIILYTNWRYLTTVHENSLKIEATLYDLITETTLTKWNANTNRIILGVYRYEVLSNKIINITEDKTLTSIILINSNVIKNSFFDNESSFPWIPINSKLNIIKTGGINNSPFLRITPLGGSYQGIAQTISIKKDVEYRCSFYIKGQSTNIPFIAKIIDGDNIYETNPIELGSITRQVGTTWTKYELVFTAISSTASFILTKLGSDTEDMNFDVDQIYIVQYAEIRKGSDLNTIKYIDGGIL